MKSRNVKFNARNKNIECVIKLEKNLTRDKVEYDKWTRNKVYMKHLSLMLSIDLKSFNKELFDQK
jgi:hypothetical protein